MSLSNITFARAVGIHFFKISPSFFREARVNAAVSIDLVELPVFDLLRSEVEGRVLSTFSNVCKIKSYKHFDIQSVNLPLQSFHICRQ
jgi:hypothetical protein